MSFRALYFRQLNLYFKKRHFRNCGGGWDNTESLYFLLVFSSKLKNSLKIKSIKIVKALLHFCYFAITGYVGKHVLH